MRGNRGILNGQLSRVISETGHTDRIVVTDAGLPIPAGVERVDLAYLPMQPPFLSVLDAVLGELVIEGATVSAEIMDHSPDMMNHITERLSAHGVTAELVPHEEFKRLTSGARAAVRSGEFTPYANVLLHAGVAYGK